MKKLMMVLGTWCLVIGAGWVQATPIMGTNTWIGAASGGSWNTSSNWKSLALGGVENLPAATTFNKNSYYVYDFSKLEDDATVWNDCTNAIRIAGLAFGEGRGTVTLKRFGGQDVYFNDPAGAGQPICDESGTTKVVDSVPNRIHVGTGTTVIFNLQHKNRWNGDSGTSLTFEGGGEFQFDAPDLELAGGMQFNLNGGTTLTVADNNPDNYSTGFYLSQIIFQDDDSVLNIKADNVRFQVIRSASGRAGKVALNGHTAGIVYGEGTSIGEIAFGGHFDGPGTLYVQGGNALKFTNAMPFRNGAALKVRTAEVAFAAGAALGADTALEMADNGRVAIGESATIKQLKGNGTMGAVTIANGKTLTVGTPDSTGSDTYSARLRGNGRFVKDGADYTLTLDGVNTYAGGTEVKAGTLRIREPNAPPAVADGLVAYYRFDDPTDVYKDEIGAADLEAMSGATITSVDGVFGGAVHFAKGTLIDPPPLRTAKNFGAAGFPINGEAISFATWVKVEESASSDTQIMLYGQWTGGGVMYLFRDRDGRFTVSSATTVSTQSSGMTLKDGKWHHVAYTYDGSQAGNRVLYVDGVQMAAGKNLSGASMNIAATDFLNLGGNGSYSYSGAMDELRIYNRVLGADEVLELYQSVEREDVVPAERVDAAVKLPAPVAKYTFDDPQNAGKDTSGNGYDLTKVGTTTYAASRKGAYGGCVKFANKSYFKADTFPAKVPTSGSFTLSLRVQPAQVETPAYVFWGKSGSTTAQEFFWAGANNNQLAEQVGSFTTGNDIVLGELFSTTGGASSGTGNEASWINMVYVYNHLAKTLSAYRDGNLVGSKAYESSFAATPDVFYLGYRPDKGIYAQCYLDDVRIFDRALTPMQVKALTRSLETGSVGPSLPASGTVTIDAGATLEVLGAGHSVPTLEGAGTLEVPRLGSVTLNNAANFSGAVTGLGSLYLKGKVGAGIDFSGFRGMMSLANEINVSSDALPVISSPNSVVALPSKGTLTITNGGASPSRFVIAEAQDFSGETSDFSGWTYSSANEWIKNVTFAIEQGDGVRRFVANVTYWLLDVPYRAWNETTRQMEDKVCTSYTVVTTETAIFEDGRWYVVVETVECGSIAVNGAAHLILMDGAKLTATAVTNEAGVAVAAGNSLTIYGQQLGTGELVAKNRWVGAGYAGACIGGVMNGGCGTVTINGGTITAISEGAGAGIGGAWGGSCGSIIINGGKITAKGNNAAGIGDGGYGRNGKVTINGGTVDASQGYSDADIGFGRYGSGTTVTISGGNVKAETIQNAPTNSANAAVWCVMVECGVQSAECGVKVEGLDGYGTNDIYPIDGKVYLYLPNGIHTFTIDGLKYRAVVKDAATTAVVYVGPTCESGEIAEGEGGVWVVTPNAGVTEVTITGLPDGDFVAVPPAVTKVSGVADNKIKVRSGAYDITGAFTVSGGAIALNPNGSVNGVPVKPTIGDLDEGEPFTLGDGSAAISVRTIPGLKYSLVRGTELGAITMTVVEPTLATEAQMTLTDAEPPTGAAFYKVVVSVP